MKKDFKRRKEEIQFKEEILELLKNKIKPSSFEFNFLPRILKDLNQSNLINPEELYLIIRNLYDLNPFLIENILNRDKKILEFDVTKVDKKVVVFSENFDNFKKEIEDDKRKLREDKLRESQIEFTKFQNIFLIEQKKESIKEKERQKIIINLTMVLALGVVVQIMFYFFEIFRDFSNIKLFFIGLVAVSISIILTIWNKIVELTEDIMIVRPNKTMIFLLIIGLILMVGSSIYESNKTNFTDLINIKNNEKIEIINIQELISNQKEIINLFEKSNNYSKEIDYLKIENQNLRNILTRELNISIS